MHGVAGDLGRVAGIEDDPARLGGDRPTDHDGEVGACALGEELELAEDFARPERRRLVQNEAEGAVGVVVDEQDHRVPEERAVQARRGHEQAGTRIHLAQNAKEP